MLELESEIPDHRSLNVQIPAVMPLLLFGTLAWGLPTFGVVLFKVLETPSNETIVWDPVIFGSCLLCAMVSFVVFCVFERQLCEQNPEWCRMRDEYYEKHPTALLAQTIAEMY